MHTLSGTVDSGKGVRQLWAAVIALAAAEACRTGKPVTGSAQARRSGRQAMAIGWIRSSQFEAICDVSDFDCRALREGILGRAGTALTKSCRPLTECAVNVP